MKTPKGKLITKSFTTMSSQVQQYLFEIHAVTELFKEKDCSELRNTYNDHKLTDNLKGYKSIHLFYGTAKDVVVIYKEHENGHFALHRIGNHDWVYDPEYQKMDKNRRIKKRR